MKSARRVPLNFYNNFIVIDNTSYTSYCKLQQNSRRAREFYFEFIIEKKVDIRKKVHSDILSEYKK